MKILIVEDEAEISGVWKEELSARDYKIKIAGDGEQAMAMAKSFMPDIILLDLLLPKKDGFEVLAEIKNSPSKNIPVLILTNLEEIDNVQKALDLGAKTFMVKSDFSLRDIIEKIKENLSPHQFPVE